MTIDISQKGFICQDL